MDREEWRVVPGFERLYEVSNFGQVRSKERFALRQGSRYLVKSRILKPCKRGRVCSYLFVTLWRCGQRKTFYVHRLVLLAFVGPPPDPRMQASHEPDPDPFNCRLDNLQWRTHRENTDERDMRRRALEIAGILPVDGNVFEEEDPSVPF